MAVSCKKREFKGVATACDGALEALLNNARIQVVYWNLKVTECVEEMRARTNCNARRRKKT